jgi:RTX calcium-binding nonapeptide repeat (4 copies)
VIEPGPGADTVNGGDGYDIVSYAGALPINANLQASTVSHAGATDTLLSVEALFGSAGNDTIVGANASGGLSANARQDTLRGGAGNDTIDGGSGVDTAEFTGARAGYTVTRNGSTITVTDIDPSNGNDGTDTLTSIERLMFSDVMLAFGTRAEELARVAFVLWTPGIAGSTTLFARGYSYYDVGYDFAEMSRTALNFWPQTGEEFAQILVRGTPGTTRTVADVLAIMNANGGPVLGRALAVQTMAMDAATTAKLEAAGVLRNGVVVAHDVAGFGTLFDLLPG